MDIDGVWADFITPFVEDLVGVTRKNRFSLPTLYDEVPKVDLATFPTCWDFAEGAGYGEEEIGRVWEMIKDPNREWWLNRPAPLNWSPYCARTLRRLCALHDVYFVTARPGRTAKAQTERWLRKHFGVPRPTVIITGQKETIATALGFDHYIDDKPGNVNGWGVGKCKRWLLTAPYNNVPLDWCVQRVGSVEEWWETGGLI